MNFFRPTTLTELLLERIKESGSPNDVSRVIHVSSMGNVLSKINPEDLDLMAVRQSPFDVNLQYCNSKVMQLHYNCHLARELAHSNTESVALHPGTRFADTHLSTNHTFNSHITLHRSGEDGHFPRCFRAREAIDD